jgi:PAS domain S-box-containing protein
LKAVDARHWLQSLFDESPVAIGFSRDGVMLDANDAYLRLFGYATVTELRGESLLDQIAPPHRARVREMVAQRARGEVLPERYETRGLRKDGTEFPFEVTVSRVAVADGPLTIAFISDMSERDDALAALMASEERFRTLAGATLEAVIIHGDGKVLLANEAAAAMCGFDDAKSMEGTSIADLTHPDSRGLVADKVRSGDARPYEGLGRRRDGQTFMAEVQGRTVSHQGKEIRVTTIRDITERKRIEAEQRALGERVRQTQRLESLAVLAGGVAHDFNNILTVISNGVALAKRDAGIDSASAPYWDAMALAAERAGDLCRQMLAYAGEGRLLTEAIDLNALVHEMAFMLDVSITKKATLVRELTPTRPILLGDATQIRQIVLNLVLNASEATAGSAGTITVTTGSGTYDAADFARSAAGGEPRPGPYVWLEVRDDGIGMDRPTAAQMFDPFFTTKFVGRGLGMAAVLGIVRSHGGAIDVESRLGQGTRVRVFFPAFKPDTVAAALPQARPAAEGSPPAGLVLVVDDEKNIRVTTELLLREMGFDVILARDGAEAIAAYRAHGGRIGAVLLDLTMPVMDGRETMKELRLMAPSLPVILTSGRGSAQLEDAPLELVPDAVLPKPYLPEVLFATLRRVLHGRERT